MCYSFHSLPFDESAVFTPPASFGPYRVLHQIGSGVLGPVFRTYDPQQDRLVAVKAFRLDVVPETVAKLADNLRRLPTRGLVHPAVVQVVDAGLEGMSAYLAMEYVSAETLDVALRHLAPAPLDRALPILTNLANAIDAAWAAGQGHGAIHPRDVFVLSGTNEVRLTGCGVLPALEAAGIRVPPRRPYSAPERGTAEAWDIRADIYSLGVLAHELLTKRRPSGASDQDGSLVTGTTPEARVLIRRVLAAALAERPQERFATPIALVEALGAIVRGEPVGPLPEGAAEAEERPVAAAKKSEAAPLLAMAEAPVFEPERATLARPASIPTPIPEPSAPASGSPDSSILKLGQPAASRRATSADRPASDRSDRPAALERSPNLSRSTPPLRLSPPPVIVPVKAAFPWVAVLAAAVAGGALGGVGGYRLGMGARPAPASATSTVPPGTDVVVPPPPTPPGAQATAQPPSAPVESTDLKASADAGGSAPPAEGSRPAAHATVARAKAESTVGSLLIETRPEGAHVVLDGRPLGVTPLSVPDVRIGSHPLRLERTGYKTLVTSVVIKSGERSRIAVTLELSGVPGPWMPPLR